MTWVRLDDKFHSNPKVLEAGLEASGLYARSLSYCGDQLTDGFVHAAWLTGHPQTLLETITEAELWEPVTKGSRRRVSRDDGTTIDVVFKADGYFIRDFLQYNPARAEVEEVRITRSKAGKKGATARWEKNRATQEEHGTSQAGAIATRNATAIPPTRPVSKSLSSSTEPPREPQPTKHACTQCGHECRNTEALREHLENVHWLEGDQLQQALTAAGE